VRAVERAATLAGKALSPGAHSRDGRVGGGAPV